MGDARFSSLYDRIHEAEDPLLALNRLSDEEVISALAEASRRRDPYLANVLATEAHNRTHRMSAIASNLGEGVVSLDRDGIILTVNPAAARLLGADMDSLIGRDAHEILDVRDANGDSVPPQAGPFQEVVARRATVRLDDVSIARAGEGHFAVSLTASPVIQDEEVQGLVVVIRDVSERRRAEAAIRASELRFRGLLESAPDAILAVDREGKIALANGRAEGLFGYGRETLLGFPIEKLIPERFHGVHVAHRERYAHDPRTRPMGEGFDLWARRRDGSEFPVEISLSPLETPEGPLVIAVIRDVTSRKRAEETIRASELRFRGLLESAPDAILAVDREGRIAISNGRAGDLFGYAREDLLHLPVERLIPERLRGVHVAHREGYGQDPRTRPMGEGLDLWARRRDGSEFPVEISLSPLETPEGPLVIAVIRDVTARRRAEEAERFLASIIRTSEDAIYAWDRDLNIMIWNPGAERLYGFRAEEAVRRSVLIVVPPGREHEPLEILERLEGGEKIEQFETKRRRKDGTIIAVSLTASPLKDAAGGVVGVSNVARDVTARKAAEAEIMESRRRLSEAQGLARLGSWVWNPDNDEVSASEEFRHLVGLGGDEGPRTLEALLLLVHPEERRAMRDLIDRSLRAFAPLDFHHRIIRADGTVRWFHTRGEVAVDRVTARPLRVLATAQDETERRAVEQALSDSEARFRAVFDRARLGVALASLDGRLFLTNQSFQQILGRSGEEISTMHFSEYTHPDDVSVDEGLARELVEGERETYELDKRYVHKDGSLVWVRLMVSLIRDDGGKPSLAAVMVQDITEKRATAVALEATRAALAQILSTASVGLVVTDPVGAPTHVNATAERLLGRPGAAILAAGGSWMGLPGDPLATAIREGRTIEGLRFEGRRRDGSLRALEAAVHPLPDAAGAVVSMVEGPP